MMETRSHSLRATPARIAALAALALGTGQANALVHWDEVTFFLTYASYSPGDAVSTKFTFGTKPGIDLSSFEFTLSWDNALATPVANGRGSVAEWAAWLGTKGSVSYGFASPLSIKGAWAADPLGGAASLISTDYAQYVKATFAFETRPALNVPFVVSIELSNIKDSAGDTVDTGSGFINWATMTPVPEPASWAGMACGLGALVWLRRSRRADTPTTALSRTG